MQRTFYTIGYEGSQVEDFVHTLKQQGIATLVDVREMPLSRKRGFSKTALRDTLTSHGIAYVHLRGLGDPKPGREAARSGDYPRFRHIFGQHMQTDYAQHDLQEAMKLVCAAPACLMCFEHDHCNCHRSIVAQHLVEKARLKVHNLVVEAKPQPRERNLYIPHQPALAY